jgi:hypothetical protein
MKPPDPDRPYTMTPHAAMIFVVRPGAQKGCVDPSFRPRRYGNGKLSVRLGAP